MNNEEVYRLIQEPNRECFFDILKDNQGEADNLDFKRKWIEFSKLAKIMLGMANVGGGILVFGIDEKEDGSIDNVGLDNFEDKADIDNKIKKYIPSNLEYDVANFDFSNKKLYKEVQGKYQILTVKSKAQEIPYILQCQINQDVAGSIYVRRGTKTIHANTIDVSRMIEKRINSTVKESTMKLEDHLAQLRVLYKANQYTVDPFQNSPRNALMRAVLGLGGNKQPDKTYNDLILEFISKKKEIIERYIDR